MSLRDGSYHDVDSSEMAFKIAGSMGVCQHLSRVRFGIAVEHALRNAIIPVVSLAAVQFGFMVGGSIVIETIFAINGLGFLAWESIQRADLPMMQAIVLVLSIFYIFLTFFADMLNAFLDPRIRVS